MAKPNYYKNGKYDPGSDPRPFSALTDPTEIAIRSGKPAPTPSVPSGVSFDPKTNISTAQLIDTRTRPGGLKATTTTTGINPLGTSGVTGLTKVATGSTGLGGPIFDVFRNGQKVSEQDFIKMGVNVADIPTGEAPAGFQSKFLPAQKPELPPELQVKQEPLVGSSDRVAAEVDQTQKTLGTELAELGIEPPKDTVSPVVDEILKGLQTRQQELEKRRTEDVARLEKGFEVATEEQKLQQEEALAQAEGRTRIGGFITQMEIKDIQNLQRKFRLENIALEGQKAEAFTAANRAYADENFQLAQSQLQVARQVEQDLSQKKQQYFQNIQTMQAYYEKLNKPILQASEADQKYAMSLLQEDPAIAQRLGIKPSDLFLGNVNMGSIITSYLDGPVYASKLRKETAVTADISEYQFAQQQGYKGSFLDYQREQANLKAKAAGALTQPQLQAKGYAERTVEADQIISSIGDKFTGLSSYIGQYAPNIFKSADRQKYEQAQRNFINAVLRRESGASISDKEFESAAKQYFPQPGDSKEVIVQKAENRQTTIQGIQGQAGQVITNPTPITDLRIKYNY